MQVAFFVDIAMFWHIHQAKRKAYIFVKNVNVYKQETCTGVYLHLW